MGDPTWSHNSAYHPWILDQAREVRGHALDVGCGDGLLVSRLSPVCTRVTGIDSSPAAIERASLRTRNQPNVALHLGSFLETDLPAGSFDLVTFVASLHHMDLGVALRRTAVLLAPRGCLLVVGPSRPRGVVDWLVAGASMPIVRIQDRRLGARGDSGVVVLADPSESLGQIRRAAAEIIPGARIRRGLYYRYLLSWTRP